MTAGILLNLRIAYMCYDARPGGVIKTPTSRVIDNSRHGWWRKANWVGPIQKVSEIHPSLPTAYYLFFRIKIDIDPTPTVRFLAESCLSILSKLIDANDR